MTIVYGTLQVYTFVMTDNTVIEKMEDASIEDKQTTAVTNDGDDFVDPWNVSSQSQTGIDYNKLISKSCEGSVM